MIRTQRRRHLLYWGLLAPLTLAGAAAGLAFRQQSSSGPIPAPHAAPSSIPGAHPAPNPSGKPGEEAPDPPATSEEQSSLMPEQAISWPWRRVMARSELSST